MTRLRRGLATATITLAVIAVGAFWVFPVVLSFDAKRSAPSIAMMVPTELKDLSLAPGPARKLSYLGFEFEVPWSDLDDSQTRLGPKRDPSVVILSFRSGFRMIVSVLPKNLKEPLTPNSWYEVQKRFYEFTPEKMHLWALSPDVHFGEREALIGKATMLSGSADTGVFNIQCQGYRGFQLGAPEAHPQKVTVNLYSDHEFIEIVFLQKQGQSNGPTQPEINRVVQSLRKAPSIESQAAS
jgi:hypothetical protein